MPRLPFSLDVSVRKVGQWDRARELTGARAALRLRRAERIAMKQEAQFARKKIIQGIRKQAPGGQRFKKVSKTTLATRRARGFRGRKALIVRADLRNSITVKTSGDGEFIGVLRTARSRDGDRLVNIAEVMEEGRTLVQRATPKVLALLHRSFREGGLRGRNVKRSVTVGASSQVLIIKIPARPFLNPVFEELYGKGGKAQFRVLLRVARILKGDYGFPVGGG